MIPQHSSETNEHYTPASIVEPARATLGAIDLDPASCPIANEVVKVPCFWSDGGLQRDWSRAGGSGSRVFLNPPGGKLDRVTLQPLPRNAKGIQGGPGLSSAAMWWAKLWSEWQCGNVEAAIFVCFSMAIFRTAQDAEMPDVPPPFMFPFCVPRERINYDKVDAETGARVATKGAPADSAIVLLPPRTEWFAPRSVNGGAAMDRFIQNFSPLGAVRI